MQSCPMLSTSYLPIMLLSLVIYLIKVLLKSSSFLVCALKGFSRTKDNYLRYTLCNMRCRYVCRLEVSAARGYCDSAAT
jgi:hypothetical protein